VPKNHTLTRHYVAELGLTLRPFVQSNPDAFMVMRGRRERVRDVTRLGAGYNLTPTEQGKSPDALWAASLVRRLDALSTEERQDLLAVEPRTEGVRTLDRLSLRQLLETEKLSAEAIEFLAMASGAETLLDTAATEHLREESQAVWSPGFDEIVGGTDRLPAAMALCTLPFPVLARVEVEPGFSGAKRRAIRELNYDSSTKILAVTARRFWEQDERIYGGRPSRTCPRGPRGIPATTRRSATPRCRRPRASSWPRTAGGRRRGAGRRCRSVSGARRRSVTSLACILSWRAPAP
jgi:monoamine oxidase